MPKETKKSTQDIGLDNQDMSKIVDQLNSVLANYHVFYMNVRGYHWNVKGSDFFTLHPDFHPNTFLGDSAFDSVDLYGILFHDFHFSGSQSFISSSPDSGPARDCR